MDSNAQALIFKLAIGAVIATGLVLAVFLGIQVSDAEYKKLAFMVVVCLLVVWTVVARDRWWLPFPVAVALGGYFLVGFRLYIHEVMLAFCFLPLVVNVAIQKEKISAHRVGIPASVYLLAGYMFFHWLGCLIYNQVTDWGGAGQTSRQYMNAGWPLILFFAFYWYGKSRYLSFALFMMYLAYLLRLVLGLYIYYTRGNEDPFNLLVTPSLQYQTIYVPFFNYIPTWGNVADLRGSAIGLASMALAYASYVKNPILKWFHFLLVPVCILASLLGGGRMAFTILLILFFFWSLIYKKFLPGFLAGMAFLGLLITININPYIVENFPFRVQRTLSAFIITGDQLKVRDALIQTNEFHEILRRAGYERWTEDFRSILVGHGVRPFNRDAWNDKLTDDVARFTEQAKLTGRYEKGIWTILATFGAVGFLLYLNVMRFLIFDAFKRLWKNQICDANHAFYFLASFSMVSFIMTMFLAGSFPSEAIMLGLFAKVASEDSLAVKIS